MPQTYEPIATSTLGSNQGSVTLGSIPQTYTDLLLVVTAKDNRAGGALGDSVGVTFNTDTATSSTNYSFTYMYGIGTSTSASGRSANSREIDIYSIGTTDASSNWGTVTAQIQNYTNTTTFKTLLSRGGSAADSTAANVGLWRNTAAITSITLWPGYNGSGYSFITGSTFTLYGIKAA